MEYHTLKYVPSSAVEAGCGGIFHDYVAAIVIGNALEGIQYPQGCATVVTDNSTATSFVHSATGENQSKRWDINYTWPQD